MPKQLTVLTGNSAKGLYGVISDLSHAGIDIRAHCLVDNGDGNCKMRMIVSDPDNAAAILQNKNITTVTNDVVIVETDDQPGGLSRLLKVFDAEDIEIEYSYTAASESPRIAVMVFRFSDNRTAVKILEKNGLKLLNP